MKTRADQLHFDLQADFCITKHMGRRKATDELIRLCQLQAQHCFDARSQLSFSIRVK